MEHEDCGGFHIIPVGNRINKSLPVGIGDKFIATAWTTAILAKILCTQQSKFYRQDETIKPFIYLIQDFEPGFYPWSTRYALAESTYRYPENFIAIFNSSLLYNFFLNEGYRFAEYYTFEPKLNKYLKDQLKMPYINRKKQILIYGRPEVERNAFDLIIMGLREWISHNPEEEWSFFSVGEAHSDIDIGSGHFVKSLGKLTLEHYAEKLRESSIGISLMISPHPSYPPLEMAAFGLHVITNSFRSKNLSVFSSNIYSLDTITPASISDSISKLSKKHYDKRDNISTFINNYISENHELRRIANDINNK